MRRRHPDTKEILQAIIIIIIGAQKSTEHNCTELLDVPNYAPPSVKYYLDAK